MNKVVSPMDAITPLCFAATRFVLKRNAKLGVRLALRPMAGSCDFLLALRDLYPTVWAELLDRLKIDDQTILERIQVNGNTREPDVQTTPKPERRKTMRYRTVQSLEAMDSSWSKPCLETQKSCSEEAKATKCLVSEVRWLTLLLERDCEARQVLLELTDASSLEGALRNLTPASDMPDLFATLMTNVVQGTESLGHPLEQEAKSSLTQSSMPGRIPKPQGEIEVIPPSEDPVLELTEAQAEFDRKLELWVDRATLKAREFKASRVLFDHMFLCLLEDETDTAKFLDARGIDRGRWRTGISTMLPIQENSTEFIRLSRELADIMPEDVQKHSIVEAMEQIGALAIPGQRDVDKAIGYIEENKQPRGFSDLLWLEDEPFSSDSIARSLLSQANITEPDIRTEIRRVLNISI